MADPLSSLEGLTSYEAIGNILGISATAALVVMAIISIWTLVWKGLALWKSSQKKRNISSHQLKWFQIINTSWKPSQKESNGSRSRTAPDRNRRNIC